MRLWSLHPRHLDRIGLVACWRESLLAQAVLSGQTKGYTHHPQLQRFRGAAEPLDAMSAYLTGIADEATERGYRFSVDKIQRPGAAPAPLSVTHGQLQFEWEHLGAKLAQRSPADAERWRCDSASPHPLFVATEGGIESWERP
ncbi:pyrimidine dimer DNA glycosylase/endonuclease V [Microbacterium alcoholitolerans]|uniref:pyrimidine dimer DNA glycosylase/endonuclease V n=1 Tax=unclassified Microbacterium TaxID=2609290 RepID=UPI003D16A55D